MKIETSLDAWRGRQDASEGELARRWHQVARPAGSPSAGRGVSLARLVGRIGEGWMAREG
jgi:hypothetical protein